MTIHESDKSCHKFDAMTGSSGTIGHDLLTFFANKNRHFTVFGRTRARNTQYPPNIEFFEYDKLAKGMTGIKAVIHLAALNDDASASLEEFRSINVDLTRSIAEAANDAGCSLFVNFTSIHATKNAKSHFCRSKFEGEKSLAEIDGMHVVNFRIPAYTRRVLTGRLSAVERLPKFLRSFCESFVGMLRPTVRIENISKALLELEGSSKNEWPHELLVSSKQLDNWLFGYAKRAIDFALSFGLMIFAFPILILIGLGVKLTSPGPSLFAQDRVGQGEKVFRCYKFRTMFLGTKVAGTHLVSAANVTRLGKFLRRWKLDELPQLYNVVRGDMSLVGPRPCLPSQVELIVARRKHGIYDIPAGITGLSQVRQVDMSDHVRLAKSDAEYLALRTLFLDFKLLFNTALGRGKGDRVGGQTELAPHSID